MKVSGGVYDANPESESVEVLLGRSLMHHEEYQILQKIMDIRKTGGHRWEMLQEIIGDTFSKAQ